MANTLRDLVVDALVSAHDQLTAAQLAWAAERGYIDPTSYDLQYGDGIGANTIEITADSLDDAISQVEDEIEDSCKGGDWGTDGASLSIGWTLTDWAGEEVADGRQTVEIDPDHEALISDACGHRWDNRHERSCGMSPDDHDWTSEGEGGCAENPGVWSTGGTSMTFNSHCRTCGLHRCERSTGSQRNPGEHDTTTYTMPETWCVECQSEDCDCVAQGVTDMSEDVERDASKE